MTATDTTPTNGDTATPAAGHHRWFDRWPTLAGLAFAAVMLVGMTGGADAALIVVAAAFVYVGAAALQTRRAAWPVFWLSFVIVGLVTAFPTLPAVPLFCGAAALLAAYGLIRGARRPGWGLPLQALAMLAFAGLAAFALTTSPVLAGLVVAGLLFAHTAYDWHHHRTERVVPRSMAEFCAVLDAALGVGVLVITFA